MPRLLPNVTLATILLATAACANAPGSDQTARTTDRDEEVPTGSILPGGMGGQGTTTTSGAALQNSTGGFNSAFHGGLK